VLAAWSTADVAVPAVPRMRALLTELDGRPGPRSGP
jgi:hypothetical protein